MTASDVTVDAPPGTGVLFAQVGRTARRWFATALAPLDLKPLQVGALHQLRGGAMTQQALGDALDLDASNVVAILNDLEGKELITRRRDPDDRRRHIVDLTVTGVQRLAEVQITLADVEERLVSALDHEQRVQLHELLTTIVSSLCAAGPCPGDPLSDSDAGC